MHTVVIGNPKDFHKMVTSFIREAVLLKMSTQTQAEKQRTDKERLLESLVLDSMKNFVNY